ncbi:MAG: hypothetical protein JW810_12165 [Sedimentisphaerales bacterium]|nr:hypothetical protein [Sedimentisphaerales bacterium]
MSSPQEEFQKSCQEMVRACREAQQMRDQLQAQYQRLQQEQPDSLTETEAGRQEEQLLGLECFRKAITAIDFAIATMEQALRDQERVRDEPE